MAIDNIIAAGIQPATPLMSPMQTMGGLMQLRGQMADQALRAAQVQEVNQRRQLVEAEQTQKNRDLTDQNTIQALGPDDHAKLYAGDFSVLRGKVQPTTLQKIQAAADEHVNKLATGDKLNLENRASALTQLKNTAVNLGAPMADGKEPDADTLNSRYRSALGGITPLLKLAGIQSTLPASITTPEELRNIQVQLSAAESAVTTALARKKATADADKAVADVAEATANAERARKVNFGTSALGVSEKERIQQQGEGIDREMTAKYRDALLKQAAQRIGIDRQRLFQDKEETHLTPEALGKMAEMFATTGTMPTLGQGKNAAAMRSQIINEAAKSFPNVQFATNQAAFQANKASLNSLQKNYDAVTAFEETAGQNLKTFLQTADKIVDTGVPWLNKPLRALDMKLLGSSDQAAANAARTTALTEIAKVLNSANASGVLSDSARHELEQLIGGDATMKQVVAAANILKQDMENRKLSYQEQIKAINNRISGKQEEAAPGGTIKARDPQGNLHEAPAGTALLPGWKLEP